MPTVKRLARQPTGHLGLAASRLVDRSRASSPRALAARSAPDAGVDVEAPLHDPTARRVTGVRFTSRDDESRPAPQSLSAALVIDCTGRGSRSPLWLREWGYEAPPEERVNIGLCYASAYFRREAAERPSPAVVIAAATPGLPRPGVLIAQEPDAEGAPAGWSASAAMRATIRWRRWKACASVPATSAGPRSSSWQSAAKCWGRCCAMSSRTASAGATSGSSAFPPATW